METPDPRLTDLHEIRQLMERSSRFLSLSGLSGVGAGVFALAGAAVAYAYLEANGFQPGLWWLHTGQGMAAPLPFLVADAAFVLIGALATAVFFSWRKAKRDALPLWDATAWRLLAHLSLPLGVGGLFCMALFWGGCAQFIAPATLVFYGMALVQGSRQTLHDLHSLGVAEMALGCLAAFFPGYGLWFWAFGFGVLHIGYGVAMYMKYER